VSVNAFKREKKEKPKQTNTVRTVLLTLLIVAVFAVGNLVGWLYFNNVVNAKIKVPYANQTISEGTRLTLDNISIIEIPVTGVNRVFIETDLDIILDQYVKVGVEIPKGSFIFSDVIAKNIGNLLKEGLVYHVIKANDSNITKGGYINIYYIEYGSASVKYGLLLDNVEVVELLNNDMIASEGGTNLIIVLSNEQYQLLYKAVEKGTVVPYSSAVEFKINKAESIDVRGYLND